MSSREKQFYDFGPFRVDPAERVLLRDGQVVPLTPKVFDTLLVFVANSGHILPRDELLKTVWAETVVEEGNLTKNVSTLRKALGERPDGHQYIETIPWRGYRFAASVREVRDESTDLILEEHTTSRVIIERERELIAPTREAFLNRIRWNKRVAVVLAAGAIVITGIAYAGWLVRRSPRSKQLVAQRKLTRFTFEPGLQSEPVWSPDGRFIAYSEERNGNFDIWVQQVSGSNPVQVTHSPAQDWQPDWSPDGNTIVFRSERNGGGLFLVPALGGDERKISPIGYRPRWSPDGNQILFYSAVTQSAMEVPKVYIVGIDGKPPRELLSTFLADFAFPTVRVAWHPDGKHVSIWGRQRTTLWEFWTVLMDGRSPVKSAMTREVEQQIKEAGISLRDFMWAPSGRAIYFEGVSHGVTNLWRIDVDPQTFLWISGPERLTTGPGADTDISVSRDGDRLAYTTRSENTRLWSLPFDAATGQTKGAGQAVTDGGMDAWSQDLSPDGKSLVFVAQRAGKFELRKKSLAENQERVLISADSYARYAPCWSHDGGHIVYRRTRPLNTERTQWEHSLVALPAQGGEEETLTTPKNYGENASDWSADGQYVIASSDRNSPNRAALCIYPLSAAPSAETEMRIVVSDPQYNFWNARFSPDGRWISFNAVRADDVAVSVVGVIPASGGEWIALTDGKHRDAKCRWSPDGKTIYFVSSRGGFANVWGIRFDPKKGGPLGEPFQVTFFDNPAQMVSPNVNLMEISLTADRLVLPITQLSGSVWILENVDH